jgi:hypothetical protein
MTLASYKIGTAVSVALDLPDISWTPTPLWGVVRASRTTSMARQYRVSIAFSAMPSTAVEPLRRILAAAHPTRSVLNEPILAEAVAHLEQGAHASARELLLRVLAQDGEDIAARVLLHRVEAEEALARGAYVKASREVAIGLVRAPRDPALNRLRRQLDAMRAAWMKRRDIST